MVRMGSDTGFWGMCTMSMTTLMMQMVEMLGDWVMEGVQRAMRFGSWALAWAWSWAVRLGIDGAILQFLTEQRGWIIFFLAIPISFFMEKYNIVRTWVFATFIASPELHDERVRKVQRQVREWNALPQNERKMMCTARNPLFTMSVRTATYKSNCFPVSCDLKDILGIDEERMTVKTEPLVNMGYMTQYLLPKGYAPNIQVEMEDLTIGGLCMGLGMETNSHRLGLMQENVVSYDIVLASGELVHVTAENQYKDLFYALPWSHGTLGFCVAIEVKITKVKEYMHIRYIPCNSQEEYCTKMTELAESEHPPSYLEATIYSKNKAMIMCGEMTDISTRQQHAKVNHINRWYKPWYYKHVEALLKKNEAYDEFIPLQEYYHRYTRSIFWEIEDLVPFSHTTCYRYLFGWLGAPKVSLLKKTMTSAVRRSVIDKHVVQDIIVPISVMSEAVDLFDEIFEVYPLLVFPIAIFDNGEYQGFLRKPEQLLPGRRYQMFFDLGAYGVPRKVRQQQEWDGVEHVRKMEAFTRRVKGYQCLYADTFMTRKEFRIMFDHSHYDCMRKKYKAEGAFPEVYDKIIPESTVYTPPSE